MQCYSGITTLPNIKKVDLKQMTAQLVKLITGRVCNYVHSHGNAGVLENAEPKVNVKEKIYVNERSKNHYYLRQI